MRELAFNKILRRTNTIENVDKSPKGVTPMSRLLLAPVQKRKPCLQRIDSAFLIAMDELLYFLPEIPAPLATKLGLYRHAHESTVAIHSLFQVPAVTC